MKKKRIFLGLALLASMGLVSCGASKTNSQTVIEVKNRGTEESGGSSIDLPDVFYSGDTEVNYTVKHQLEQSDGSFDTIKTETSTDIVNGKTNAVANTYEGFTVMPFEQVDVKDDSSTELIIKYRANSYTVTLTADSNYVNVAGSGEYNIYNNRAHLVAKTKIGYEFTGWYDGDTLISDKAEYSLDVKENCEFTAKFKLSDAYKDYVFESDFSNCTITEYLGSDTDLVVPEGVTVIAKDVFMESDVNYVTLPKTLKSIEENAFSKCNKLVSVEIQSNADVDPYAFYCDYGVKEVIGSSDYYDAISEISSYNSADTIETKEESNLYEDENGFIWYTKDDIYLSGRSSTDTNVVLPDSVTINGEEVTSYKIDTYAFYESDITTIVISSAVSSIGTQAFYDCVDLIEVINLSSLSIYTNSSYNGYVGKYAKSVVKSVEEKTIFQDGDLLYSLSEIDGVTTATLVAYVGDSENMVLDKVGDYPTIIPTNFQNGNDDIKTLVIGEGITKISSQAFYDCYGLESVVINASCVIESASFQYCAYLKTVELTNATEIASSAFQNDSSLETISMPNVETIGVSAFESCSSLKSIEAPKAKTIGNAAFRYCSSLESLSIDNVTSIGENTFFRCYALENINFGNIETIGERAFEECVSLMRIELPESLTTIDSYAFLNCTRLYEIINKSNLTLTLGGTDNGYVAYYAFSIIDDSANTKFEKDEDGFITYTEDGVKKLISYVGENKVVVVPNDINIIGNYAFKDTKITSLTIPNTVTKIEEDIVYNVETLTYLELPIYKLYKYLGNNKYIDTALGIKSLNVDLVFNDNDTEFNELTSELIDNNYFKSMNIPSTITTFDNISDDCINDIYYDGTFEDWLLINKLDTPLDGTNNLYVLDENGEFEYGGKKYSLVEEVTVPEGTTEITSYQYAGLKMTSITIPASVTKISERAFYLCKNLEHVYFEDNSQLETIDDYAFYGTGLVEFNIPASVTTIGELAFANSKILSITIPETVTNFDPSAINIETLIIAKIYSPITYIDSYAFQNAYNLRKIVLPDTVERISNYAFDGCDLLSSINIPSSLIYIDNYAFNNCARLTELDFSNSNLTTIGSYAFKGCVNLTDLYLPDTIETFDNTAIVDLNLNYNDVDGAHYLGNANSPSVVLVNVDYDAEEVYVPDTCKVIFNDVFKYRSDLRSLRLPASYVLPYNSLYACESLESIEANFAYGFRLNDFLGSSYVSQLKKIVLCEGYTYVYSRFAYGLTNLESVTIPDSVTKIGQYAFYNCGSLTELNISEDNQIATVETYAFYNSGITNFVVGTKCKTFGSNAFYYATNLKTIYNLGSLSIVAGATNYGYLAYYATNIFDDLKLLPYTQFTYGDFTVSITSDVVTIEKYNGTASDVTVPSEIEYNGYVYDKIIIGDNAFTNSTIESVYIPNTVTSIGNSAFASVTTLKSVTFEEDSKLTTIGSQAFISTGIETITLPDSLLYIYEAAFSQTPLTSIVIPNSVVTMSDAVFNGCTSLKSIDLGTGVQSIGASLIGESQVTSLTIPASVTLMNSAAFGYLEYLETVVINSSTIYAACFYGCTKLNSVTIGSNVKSIYSSAFGNCTALEEITIPSTVTSLASASFDSCSGLKVLNIDIATINSGIFYSLSSLTTINFGSNVKTISGGAFSDCRGITDITIPSTVEYINSGAFYNCTGITKAVVAANYVSAGAFQSCSGIKNLTVTSDVETVETGAFSGCSNIETIDYNAPSVPNALFQGISKLTTVVLGNNVTSIGESAFVGCTSLANLTLPSYLESIGSYAFTATKITSVVIPSTVTTVGDSAFTSISTLQSVEINNAIISNYMFAGCPNISSLKLSDNVTTIGAQVFAGCSLIKSLTLSENVQSVGNQAFAGTGIVTLEIAGNPTFGTVVFSSCTALTTIKMDNLTAITDSMFAGCSSLASITIPASVASIGANAFNDCTGLKSVIIEGTVSTIGDSAFANCELLEEVVMTNTTTIGNLMFSECTALTTLVLGEALTSVGDDAFSDEVTVNIYNGPTATDMTLFDGKVDYIEYKYSETEPTNTGNYWHYVEGAVTVW